MHIYVCCQTDEDVHQKEFFFFCMCFLKLQHVELSTFIQQGHINLFKRDIKDFYIVKKKSLFQINVCSLSFPFIRES